MATKVQAGNQVREWPFWQTFLVLLFLGPFAGWLGLRVIPNGLPDMFDYPLMMLVASALLSILGRALTPSAGWRIVTASALIVIVGLFGIWLLTSSIGGWKPSPLGIAFSCFGACAGLAPSSIFHSAKRFYFVAGIWLLLFALGYANRLSYKSAVNLQHLAQYKNAPAYFESHVMPLLFTNPPAVQWTKQGALPGYEDSGGGFGADGQFANGSVHLEVTGNRANFGITVEDAEKGPNTARMSDLIDAPNRVPAWLKSLGIRAEQLTIIRAKYPTLTAQGPDDLGELIIQDRAGNMLMSGRIVLPSQ